MGYNNWIRKKLSKPHQLSTKTTLFISYKSSWRCWMQIWRIDLINKSKKIFSMSLKPSEKQVLLEGLAKEVHLSTAMVKHLGWIR